MPTDHLEKQHIEAARALTAVKFAVPAVPRIAYSWRVQDRTHKGQGWSIFASSMQHAGAPTIADGMTRDNAMFLTLAAIEYHGLVEKLAELRRRDPDTAVLTQIGELVDAALAIAPAIPAETGSPAAINASARQEMARVAEAREGKAA